MTALAKQYERLGFRVIDGGRTAKTVLLTTVGISEIFGKNHNHVIRDVNRFQQNLRPNMVGAFAEHCRSSKYRARDNTERNCFELTERGFHTIAATYDPSMSFLLAGVFDAIRDGDDTTEIVQQVLARSRELRFKKTGQEEITFEPTAPTVVEPEPAQYDDDEDDAIARAEYWGVGASAMCFHAPDGLLLDKWADHDADRTFPIRCRRDLKGNPFMLWYCCEEGTSNCKSKILVPNADGRSRVMVCFGKDIPPFPVIERNFRKLGEGDYTPIAIATLRHWYGNDDDGGASA